MLSKVVLVGLLPVILAKPIALRSPRNISNVHGTVLFRNATPVNEAATGLAGQSSDDAKTNTSKTDNMVDMLVNALDATDSTDDTGSDCDCPTQCKGTKGVDSLSCYENCLKDCGSTTKAASMSKAANMSKAADMSKAASLAKAANMSKSASVRRDEEAAGKKQPDDCGCGKKCEKKTGVASILLCVEECIEEDCPYGSSSKTSDSGSGPKKTDSMGRRDLMNATEQPAVGRRAAQVDDDLPTAGAGDLAAYHDCEEKCSKDCQSIDIGFSVGNCKSDCSAQCQDAATAAGVGITRRGPQVDDDLPIGPDDEGNDGNDDGGDDDDLPTIGAGSSSAYHDCEEKCSKDCQSIDIGFSVSNCKYDCAAQCQDAATTSGVGITRRGPQTDDDLPVGPDDNGDDNGDNNGDNGDDDTIGAGVSSAYHECEERCSKDCQSIDIGFSVSQCKSDCSAQCQDAATAGGVGITRREPQIDGGDDLPAGLDGDDNNNDNNNDDDGDDDDDLPTTAGAGAGAGQLTAAQECEESCSKDCQTVDIAMKISRCKSDCSAKCASGVEGTGADAGLAGVGVLKKKASAPAPRNLVDEFEAEHFPEWMQNRGPTYDNRAPAAVAAPYAAAAVPIAGAAGGYASYDACMQDCGSKGESLDMGFKLSQGAQNCESACAAYDAGSGVLIK
ncbi:hypothetical protein GGR56DRAFT_674728 [Xylariaceae sp. FL0804]|nr:hypothetical protein GGR56DRAFT_674728 [Xylariaceae sp. FL0804]